MLARYRNPPIPSRLRRTLDLYLLLVGNKSRPFACPRQSACSSNSGLSDKLHTPQALPDAVLPTALAVAPSKLCGFGQQWFARRNPARQVCPSVRGHSFESKGRFGLAPGSTEP